MEKKQAKLGKFDIIKTIGKGGTSKVKLAVDRETGKQYAIKILKEECKSYLNKEVQVLQKINHPNIVNIIEYFPAVDYSKKSGEIKQVTAAVLELAPHGELYDYITRPESSQKKWRDSTSDH